MDAQAIGDWICARMDALEKAAGSKDEDILAFAPPSPRVYGEDEWRDIQFGKWRNGQQFFLPIVPEGGYIINYSFEPARVSKWFLWEPNNNITPLPSNVRLLYKRDPNYEHKGSVKEFTDEEVGNMDMETLGYAFVDKWFSDKWETISEPPRMKEEEEQQPATESEQQHQQPAMELEREGIFHQAEEEEAEWEHLKELEKEWVELYSQSAAAAAAATDDNDDNYVVVEEVNEVEEVLDRIATYDNDVVVEEVNEVEEVLDRIATYDNAVKNLIIERIKKRADLHQGHEMKLQWLVIKFLRRYASSLLRRHRGASGAKTIPCTPNACTRMVAYCAPRSV